MNRRSLILAVAASAGVLVTSSAAYACTAFLGTFTVTPSSSAGTTSGASIVEGTDACSPSIVFNMTQSVTQNTATAQDVTGVPAGDTQSITISTGTGSNGCKLPATGPGGLVPAHYDINFYNSNGVQSPGYVGSNWGTDCMSPLQGPGGTKLGVVLMGATGQAQAAPGGSLTFLLPPAARVDTAGESSAVCISNPTGDYGNQAPLTIV